jgi:murein DD-endopeptidase MepM/ murein hydrolase activator NlpD
MQRLRLLMYSCLALALLGACREGEAGVAPQAEATAAPQATRAQPAGLPTPLRIEATLAPPGSPPGIDPGLDSPAAGDSPAADWQVCSPLEGIGLGALAELVSDPYNPPPAGSDARHQGVDFSFYRRGGRESIAGLGVQAALAGRVAGVIANRIPYGNMLVIETPAERIPAQTAAALGAEPGEALYLLYAHLLEAPPVQPGGLVACGQTIGQVGQSGGEGTEYAIPHLHLEARWGPPGWGFTGMAFYDTRATAEEMETYRRWRTSGEFRHFDPLDLLLGP